MDELMSAHRPNWRTGSRQRGAQVASYTLDPEPLAGALNDASQLRLTGAQDDRLLGIRPVLDQVTTP
eukprot:10291820-Alexandrium_andersonii.AAC.1